MTIHGFDLYSCHPAKVQEFISKIKSEGDDSVRLQKLAERDLYFLMTIFDPEKIKMLSEGFDSIKIERTQRRFCYSRCPTCPK